MIGRTFLGRYEVTKLLGEGGMGRVYLAKQTDLGRQVVVKVMHDHIAADPKFRERFQRETLLMARFHHPFAVALFDASLNDPAGPCIVMEYVKGGNLEDLLKKAKKMTPLRVARIVAQLSEVLQAAHDENIIHRDLKPANLMVTEPDTPKERIKVMDFGLAKMIDGPARQVTDTTVDFAVGTPAYICPEQVRGEPMDHRGDLYSVGVMAYELLSGRTPFLGSSGMDVLLAHATEEPPTFADIGLAGWVPRGVEAVIRRCLEKDPDDRQQSAREFADEFAAAIKEAKAEARGRAAVHPDSELMTDGSVLLLETVIPPPATPAPVVVVSGRDRSSERKHTPSPTPVVTPSPRAKVPTGGRRWGGGDGAGGTTPTRRPSGTRGVRRTASRTGPATRGRRAGPRSSGGTGRGCAGGGVHAAGRVEGVARRRRPAGHAPPMRWLRCGPRCWRSRSRCRGRDGRTCSRWWRG